MKGQHEITLGKEDMKFSSAHFTLFEGSVERLHGHNYRVQITLRSPRVESGLLVDFGVVKSEARALCAGLDETLLLPGRHPDVRIDTAGGETEVRCRGKRYVLPADECRILPIANVTCEGLAAWFAERMLERLRPQLQAAGVVALVTTVEESPGQNGRFEATLSPG